MSVYIDQRNERIRKDYQKTVTYNKRIGIKHPAKLAIEELFRKYGALGLSIETFAKICRDPNYGATPESKTDAAVVGQEGDEDKNSPGDEDPPADGADKINADSASPSPA